MALVYSSGVILFSLAGWFQVYSRHDFQKDTLHIDCDWRLGAWSFKAWVGQHARGSRVVRPMGLTASNQCIGVNALRLAGPNCARYVFSHLGIPGDALASNLVDLPRRYEFGHRWFGRA